MISSLRSHSPYAFIDEVNGSALVAAWCSGSKPEDVLAAAGRTETENPAATPTAGFSADKAGENNDTM